MCAACPVRAECLAYAQRWYDNAEPTQPHGTWGGVLWLVPKPKLPSNGVRPAPIERSTACGRVVAYRRHLANGERPCYPCMLAMIKELRRQEKRKAGVWAK